MNEFWDYLANPDSKPRLSAIILVWILVGFASLILIWPGGAGRRLARQVYAVAVLGFREGLRMKVLWTVCLLGFGSALIAFFSEADGTHAGRARLIIDTALSTGEMLGASIIVLLSALSVAREIESRIMHTFGTKPIPRWSILLGKALGFWAVDLLFLIGLTAFTAVLVRMVPNRPETRIQNSLVASGDWELLRRNALTTRHYRTENDAPANPTFKFIKPGDSYTWEFNVDGRENEGEALSVKFLLTSTLYFASHIENVHIVAGYKGESPLVDKLSATPQDRPFEFFFDPDKVSHAGIFDVTIKLESGGKNNQSLVIQRPAGVQMGTVADTFGQSMFKSFLLMALQGWILALITASWSGVLSFPVTVALGAILVLGGEMSRNAAELIENGERRTRELGLATNPGLQQNVLGNLQMFLRLLPDFRAAGGPAAFVDGKIISSWSIAGAALWMGVVRGIGWALPGVFFFHLREVGK